MFRMLTPLVLASASPRRAELLRLFDLQFTVEPANIAEEAQPGENPEQLVRRLAEEKAQAVEGLRERAKRSCILAADTVVALGSEVLGKPEDKKDAFCMLEALSGKKHSVWGGFCLLSGDDKYVETTETIVSFASLSKRAIDSYIATHEPFDKAGAYAIQGKGAFFAAEIKGSYTNVVGLHVPGVLAALQEMNIIGLLEKPQKG